MKKTVSLTIACLILLLSGCTSNVSKEDIKEEVNTYIEDNDIEVIHRSSNSISEQVVYESDEEVGIILFKSKADSVENEKVFINKLSSSKPVALLHIGDEITYFTIIILDE